MVVVLDTDPGVDDMLALLLLLSASVKECDFRMITLTYGNCSLLATLKNVLSLFNVVQQENKWRSEAGLPVFTEQRPEIYLGSNQALNESELPEIQELHSLVAENAVDATDVHGSDGLAGIHETHPEFDAPEKWFKYFGKQSSVTNNKELPFVAGGNKPAWRAIIDLLKKEEPGTVTIITIGPLTNVAKAAQLDPAAFSRVKQVLSMGAALRVPGNITPLAEFNVYADPLAAAQIYALTSRNPKGILPSSMPSNLHNGLEKPLRLVLFPLDITHKHQLNKQDVEQEVGGVLQQYPQSVLACWVRAWMIQAFANYGKLAGKGPDSAECDLHDPLTAAYVLHFGKWEERVEDVRVEEDGRWALGLTIVDDRGRARQKHNPHDIQKWLTEDEGNSVVVAESSPFGNTFGRILLQRITQIQK